MWFTSQGVEKTFLALPTNLESQVQYEKQNSQNWIWKVIAAFCDRISTAYERFVKRNLIKYTENVKENSKTELQREDHEYAELDRENL